MHPNVLSIVLINKSYILKTAYVLKTYIYVYMMSIEPVQCTHQFHINYYTRTRTLSLLSISTTRKTDFFFWFVIHPFVRPSAAPRAASRDSANSAHQPSDHPYPICASHPHSSQICLTRDGSILSPRATISLSLSPPPLLPPSQPCSDLRLLPSASVSPATRDAHVHGGLRAGGGGRQPGTKRLSSPPSPPSPLSSPSPSSIRQLIQVDLSIDIVVECEQCGSCVGVRHGG